MNIFILDYTNIILTFFNPILDEFGRFKGKKFHAHRISFDNFR